MKFRILLPAVILLTLLCGLTQLQPAWVSWMGGVAGSFGARQQSHQCYGISLNSQNVPTWLPMADLSTQIGLFSFRYQLTPQTFTSDRPYCIGQDLWFGE